MIFQVFTNAQQFVLTDSINVENKRIKSIETDLYNSIYLISDTKVEKVFENQKSTTLDFKNIITSVDSSNPLRFYLYSNYNKLSILDENLNPIQDAITFSSNDYIPTALKIADNQFCWFYDMLSNKIVYYNYQLQKTILSSKQLYLKNNDQSIDKIHLYKNLVYLKGQHTIYIYDDYGNFKSNLEIELKNEPFLFYKNFLFYKKNNKLYSLNLENNTTSTFIDLKEVKSIALNERNLYALNDNYVFIFSIK